MVLLPCNPQQLNTEVESEARGRYELLDVVDSLGGFCSNAVENNISQLDRRIQIRSLSTHEAHFVSPSRCTHPEQFHCIPIHST